MERWGVDYPNPRPQNDPQEDLVRAEPTTSDHVVDEATAGSVRRRRRRRRFVEPAQLLWRRRISGLPWGHQTRSSLSDPQAGQN